MQIRTRVPAALLALSLTGAASAQTLENAPVERAVETPLVELCICLDTSGSMDGLIEAAKQKLWAVVNDLALAEPTPQLRVALLTYGNNGHVEENGWVKIDSPFTEDLDLISQQLFALTTNGGTELVARVMKTSLDQLDWTDGDHVLKLMVVAGNEGANQDSQFDYRSISTASIQRGIMVNSIYCGNPMDGEAPGWNEIAKLSDGHYATIDQNNGTVVIETPFDGRLTELSTAMNGTFVPYGELGEMACNNQWAQDANALSLNGAAAASRAQTKASKLYSTAHWDLVAACQSEDFDLAAVEVADLPEELQKLSTEELAKHVEVLTEERKKLQEQINDLSSKRDRFVAEEMSKVNQAAEQSFDFQVRSAIRKQAGAKGLEWAEALPEPPAPEELPANTPAEAPQGQSGQAATQNAGQQGGLSQNGQTFQTLNVVPQGAAQQVVPQQALQQQRVPLPQQRSAQQGAAQAQARPTMQAALRQARLRHAQRQQDMRQQQAEAPAVQTEAPAQQEEAPVQQAEAPAGGTGNS